MNLFHHLYRALADRTSKASLYEIELVESDSGTKHRHIVKAFSKDDAIGIAIDITSASYNLKNVDRNKTDTSGSFLKSDSINLKKYLKPNVIPTYKASAHKLTNASGFKAGHFIRETTKALGAGEIDTIADAKCLRSKAQTGININIISCFCWLAILILSLVSAAIVYTGFDSKGWISLSPLISMSIVGCIASPLGIVTSIRKISILSKFILSEPLYEDESSE